MKEHNQNTPPVWADAKGPNPYAIGTCGRTSFAIMGKAPAFQFYSSDFLTGTMLMSNAEVGLYIRLLCLQAEHGPIPDDVDRIVQAFGEPSRILWPVVRSKFSEGEIPGTLVNDRLSEVLAAREEHRKKQSEKGKKSVQLRLNRGSTTVEPLEDRDRVLEEKERATPFDAWWKLYRKGSRKLSEEQWAKMLEADRLACLGATPAYLASKPDPIYRKDGERFLKNRTWEDPIIEARLMVNGKPQGMTKEEARAAVAALREKNGIAPGAFIEMHLIPEHIRKVLQMA